MLYLRLFLFLGLVFHKLVWEIMKRRDATSPDVKTTKTSYLKSVIKFVKILFLLFILVQTLFLDVFPLTEQSLNLRIIGVIIYSLGLGIAVTGRVQLGTNWANLEDYQILSSQNLVDTGIYRYIRHPIYTGDILLLIGLELALNSWLVLGVLALIPYVIWQAKAEEELLLNAFPDYHAYQKQTKMFIPYLI
jgi:protein-S-isoprenylcysteine O-methyltransferase Ste14